MVASIATGQAASAALTARSATQETGLREAAQQFEAILLRQMLASARNVDFGGNELFGGESDDTFREMRDAQFADVASQSGQFGFAASIEKQLSRHIRGEG